MATLLDTNIVIHLRDGDAWVEEQVRTLDPPLCISAITRVELENGVQREPRWASLRRAALDQLLVIVTTLDFGAREIDAYRKLVEATGYSRRKTADRMIAATALAHGLTLVTVNGRDFRDAPGLNVIEWERPGE